MKFGQALSTRRDLLPVDIADELAKLQDRVPPFGSDVAVATIERALRPAAGEIFLRFEETPLGGGLDRAGACGAAQERRRSGGENIAPRDA